MTEIYRMYEKPINIPCGHCGDDLWTEIIDEGSHEAAHHRWSQHLDVTCHCGAINIFYCHWTPYTVEMWELQVPAMDDPREEALTASERNKSLTEWHNEAEARGWGDNLP